jgi:hypothetical protein
MRNTVRTRRNRVHLTLATASLIALGACSEVGTDGPTITDPPPPPAALRSASFVADVNLVRRTIRITSPTGGLDLDVIADYFGLEPGHPELSILGGDVVEVLPVASSISFAAPNAASLKRRVAFNLQIRNKLQGVALIGSTNLPIPPTGVLSPVLFPYENVTTVTEGGVTGGSPESNDVIVEMPSEGSVVPSDSIWTGPEHNFFNDTACGGSDNDCFLYKVLHELGTHRDTIGGLARSDTVRLGWDVDLTVNQFRSRLILAANLIDAVPNVLPTAAFTPAPGAGVCMIGTPIALNGGTSTDTDGFIAMYEWDFGNNGTTDATGVTANAPPPATPGNFDVKLTVTDNRGGQDTEIKTYSCAFPPANAMVTKTLQNTGGSTITAVEAGGTYQFTIVATNQSPVTPLTSFTINDVLDSDIATSSVFSGPGAIAAGTYSHGPVTLNPSQVITVVIRFTLAAGSAGQTLNNTVTIASPDDTNAADNTASIPATAISAPANVFVRWVNSSGAPISSATVGQIVYAQICTSVNTLVAFDGSLQSTVRANITSPDATPANAARDLESNNTPPPGAGAVHPDCVGTADELDDFFTANVVNAQRVDFGVAAVAGTSTGSAKVGIAEVRYTAAQAGTETLNLIISNFDAGGPTAVVNSQALTINP